MDGESDENIGPAGSKPIQLTHEKTIAIKISVFSFLPFVAQEYRAFVINTEIGLGSLSDPGDCG